MPNYEYKCDECAHSFERMLKIAQYKDPQDCPECGHGPAKKMITGGSGFILRGDGWAGKNNRVKSQMRRKNQRLRGKEDQWKRDASPTLTPNVGGEQVESWSDASKLARAKGKDTSGYDKLARKEKK
jgi:putative FmdB family regulatory protein